MNPATIAIIAVIVGSLVKVLRTDTVVAWLETSSWAKPIPKWLVPWLAMGLAIAASAVDARLNGGLATWQDAFVAAVNGVLAGSAAIAGHEALKTARRVSKGSV